MGIALMILSDWCAWHCAEHLCNASHLTAALWSRAHHQTHLLRVIKGQSTWRGGSVGLGFSSRWICSPWSYTTSSFQLTRCMKFKYPLPQVPLSILLIQPNCMWGSNLSRHSDSTLLKLFIYVCICVYSHAQTVAMIFWNIHEIFI